VSTRHPSAGSLGRHEFLTEPKDLAFFLSAIHNTRYFVTGLPSHPQHEVAKKQCKGFSGMVSFRIKGDLETSKKFFKALKVQLQHWT